MSEDNSREERIKRNLKKFLSLESRNRLPQVNRPGPNKAIWPREISSQKKVQISGRSLMFACKILKLYAHINHLVTMNTNEKITFPSSRQNPASQFFHFSERQLYYCAEVKRWWHLFADWRKLLWRNISFCNVQILIVHRGVCSKKGLYQNLHLQQSICNERVWP